MKTKGMQQREMNKGIFQKMAALTLALACTAGQALAAQHGEGTTIMRERGTAQANIRDRVASIMGSTEPPRNRVFSPGTSRLMRLWPVESYDTGGTLLFSDSPEYVKEVGILYRDTVTGDARVLYYHLNDTAQPKKVAVVLETEADLATVTVTRGAAAAPSTDYLHVGKTTQIGYFDTREMNEHIYVTKERPRLLVPEMDTTVLAPGQLVYGVYDFHANAPVRVSVIMYGADVDPFAFLRIARVLPRDEIALRGTFRGMNRVITAQKTYRPAVDGAVYFPIGDNVHDVYRRGIDATDGSPVVNYGNYGILYQINIPTTGVRWVASMRARCARRTGRSDPLCRHLQRVATSAIRHCRSRRMWQRRARRGCSSSRSIRSSPISVPIQARSRCPSSIHRRAHRTFR